MFKIPFSNSELKLNSNFLRLSWYFLVKICYNISTLSRNMLMKKQNVLYPKAVKAIKTMGENLEQLQIVESAGQSTCAFYVMRA